MRKTILIGFLFFSLYSTSQTPVSPATMNMGGGSAAITPSFVVDWSVGESTGIETWYGKNPFSNSILGIDWNVTSGVLQPFDITHILNTTYIPSWTNQEIRFYPVPTPGMVSMDFRSLTSGKITIQLLSHDLKLIGSKEFTQLNGSSTQTWNLSNQISGVYYFKIVLRSFNGEILKQGTFKVEKIK